MKYRLKRYATKAVASFRFRRFSRAAYAVFASLHKHVTIGTLNGLAADAQIRKSGNDTLSGYLSVKADEKGDEEKNLTDSMTVAEIQGLLSYSALGLSCIKVPAHAACDSTDNGYFYEPYSRGCSKTLILEHPLGFL